MKMRRPVQIALVLSLMLAAQFLLASAAHAQAHGNAQPVCRTGASRVWFESTPGSFEKWPGANTYTTGVGVQTTSQWTAFQLIAGYVGNDGQTYHRYGTVVWTVDGFPPAVGPIWVDTGQGWVNLTTSDDGPGDINVGLFGQAISQVDLPNSGAAYAVWGLYHWDPFYNAATNEMVDPGHSSLVYLGTFQC
jgi:hypothetical protein